MPLEKLPEGFAPASSTDRTDDQDIIDQQDRPDTSVLDIILGLPSGISEAMSGENVPIEFPQLPELTDMGSDAPGFFEGFLPRMKAMLARDDYGKAEIIHDAFDGDPRYGGKYRDKFGLPIIVWNNIPYYVNKPGVSGQDFNTLLGEVVRYTPASRFAAKGKTALETALRGTGAYSATELATIAGESLITPETTAQKKRTIADIGEQVATSTAIGVGADVALPPAAQAIGRGVRRGAQAASKAGRDLGAAFDELFPRFSFDVISESKYPLTVGQRTAPPPQGVTPRQTEQLGREDQLRQMASSEPATMMIRGFDDAQLAAIRNDAVQLQSEFGAGTVDPTGIYGNIPGAAAEEAQRLVTGAAERLKQQAGDLYQAVKTVDTPPVMTPDGVGKITQELLDTIPEFMAPSQVLEGPLYREMTQLRRLRKLARNPKFRDQSLKNVHGYQKRLKAAVGEAQPGSTQQKVLIEMKNKLDDAVYSGIERGFISGDQEVLDQLQEATGLYADYMTTVGRGVGRNRQERAANTILEQLSNNQYTPIQVTNLLFGQNKFAPNQAVSVVLDKLQKSLEPDDYQQFIALLKDGIMTKAFAGKGGEITRKSIVENYNDVFSKNRRIIEKVFSPDEIARIQEFRANVLPTLWAETKMNPSATGYTLMSAAMRLGMLTTPSVMGRAAFAKGIDIAESVQAREDALSAVSQTLQRMQTPMFSAAAQAAIRTAISTEIEAEAAPSEGRERVRLLEAIDNLNTVRPDEEALPIRPTAPQTQPQQMEIESMFEPLPDASPAPVTGGFDPATSAIVLPRADDRELAERLRGPLGGIASLA